MPTVDIEVVADLEEIEVHSPEWHEARKQGIGGSDAGAVCGVNKWKTPYQVWAEKVSTGTPPLATEESEPIVWGKLLEAPVRDEFSRRSGIEVIPFPRMVRNRATPFMLANVDGLTGTPEAITGVYEGKTSRFEWLQDGAVEVPLEYAIQGQHYLAVLGLDVVHYACLVGGQRLRVAEVERNDSLIDDLVAIEEAFWDKYVITGYPPPVEAGDKALLSKQWTGSGKGIELSGTMATTLEVLAGHNANIKHLEHERDTCLGELMAFMGEATEATYQGETKITWRPQSRTSIDSAALKEAHPALAAEFSKTSHFRKFLVK